MSTTTAHFIRVNPPIMVYKEVRHNDNMDD